MRVKDKNQSAAEWAAHFTEEDRNEMNLSSEQLQNLYRSFSFCSNDLFRFTFLNHMDLCKYLISTLTNRHIISVTLKNCEPGMENGRRKIRFDLLCEWLDDNGNKATMCVEITNYGTGQVNINRGMNYLFHAGLEDEPHGEDNLEDAYSGLSDVFSILITGSISGLESDHDILQPYQFANTRNPSAPFLTRAHLIFIEADHMKYVIRNKKLQNWTEAEKLIYFLYHSEDDNDVIIKELVEQEVFQHMEDAKEEYAESLYGKLCRIRSEFDEYMEKKTKADMEKERIALDADKASVAALRAGLEADIARVEAEKADMEAKKATVEAERADVEAKKATVEAERADVEAKMATVEAEKASISEERLKLNEEKQQMEKDRQEIHLNMEILRRKRNGTPDSEICRQLNIPQERILEVFSK